MSTSDETHKVENWSEYNDALVDRGRLTVWLSEDAIEGWKDQSPPQQGAQWIFTDLAIQTCLQIKVVYGLGLRETEGFIASLFELMGLEELPVPDYTTLSKRQGDLDVDLSGSGGGSGARPMKGEETTAEKATAEKATAEKATAEEESMHLVIDSTGLKVYGEGEWKQRIHGKQKRRTWRKLHLGVDSGTGEPAAVTLTDNTSGDGSQVEPLLEETLSGTSETGPSDAEAENAEAENAEAENAEAEDTVLDTVGADGAYDTWDVYDYDTWDVYEVISDYGATPVIPPQKNAKIKKHGNCSGPPLPRDEAIRYIRGHGRKKWKRASGYHRRSLAETAVYRFKQLMGRFVEARRWENERTEVRLKAKALNKMTLLGMPETSKTAV
jgi:hypothetical protein